MLCGKTGVNLLLRVELGISQQQVSDCTVHHLSFLGFIPILLTLLFTTTIIIIDIFNFISVIELFLSQTKIFNFFSNFFPHPIEWHSMSSSVVLGLWLGLKDYTTHIYNCIWGGI